MANAKRALVVVDVQNEYVTGNFLIEYPPVAGSLANIGKAMDAAREHGIPIVAVQHMAPAESPIFARGSHGVALHEVVASRHYDHLVKKELASSFAGTDLGAWLKARGIDTLTVVGYMTQHCNESTIRQAMHEGYQVEFLADASGSLPYETRTGRLDAKVIHDTACVVMQAGGFAAVVNTDEWVATLSSGAAFERDNVYSANQRYLASRATR